MKEYMSKGIIIGEQKEYEFDGKKYYKLPLLLGVIDSNGNFNDKAVVGVAKGEEPIVNPADAVFGTKIMCTVNERTYNEETSYVCSDLEILKKKQ